MMDKSLNSRDYAVSGHSGPAAIIGVSAAFATLSTLAVAGKFAARHIRGIKLWIDDWLLIPALLCSYVNVGLNIRLVLQGGAGYPLSQHTPEQLTLYTQTLAVIQFFFALALGLSKMSLCLLLTRIFPVKRFKIWAYIVLAYQVSWTIAAIFLGAFICRPFSYNWDKTIDGTCGNVDRMYLAVAVTDLIGDVLIVILPLPSVWRLKASVLKRFRLTILFTLGILEIIVGIFRIIVLLRVTRATDFTLDAVETNYLSVIEPSLGVTIACMATLNPLLRISYQKITETARGLLSSTFTRGSDSTKRQTGAQTKGQTGVQHGAGLELANRPHSQHGEASRVLHDIDQQSGGTFTSEETNPPNETRRNEIETTRSAL